MHPIKPKYYANVNKPSAKGQEDDSDDDILFGFDKKKTRRL